MGTLMSTRAAIVSGQGNLVKAAEDLAIDWRLDGPLEEKVRDRELPTLRALGSGLKATGSLFCRSPIWGLRCQHYRAGDAAGGRTAERIAAITLIALMFASLYLARQGPVHALVSGGAFVILTFLAMGCQRWWITGTPRPQLVVLSTHFAPLLVRQETI